MAPPPMKAARLPAAGPPPVLKAKPVRSGPPKWPFVLGGVAALGLVGLVVAILALPSLVRDRCVAAAAARGVKLTIGSVSIALGGVRLVDVGFTLDGVPQLAGKAATIDVGLSGLTPTDATAQGLAITLDGAAEDVQNALDAWRGAQAKKTRATEASGAANKLSYAGAKLTWTRPFGQTAKLEALDVSGDADGGSNAVHLASDKVTVTAGRATFGPWRVTLERDAQGTRTHLELDPVIHGGPQATYVRDAAGVTSLHVTLPRSPLSRIGVPPKGVGLASDPDVQGTIDFGEQIGGASTLKASLALSRATFSGFPVDARLDLTASGNANQALDVKQGVLVAGPLRASVTGTVKLFPDGVRIALAWRANPIPCAELVKQLASQALAGNPLAAQLGAMAGQAAGALGIRVSGQATASGLITLDSRDVGSTSTSMTANDTCGLAMF